MHSKATQDESGADGTGPEIWLDVTGILRWGVQPPTGIQRVEQSLAYYARTAGDIGFAAFDFRLKTFLPLSDREAAYLEHILQLAQGELASSSVSTRLLQQLSHLGAQARHSNPETGRRIAGVLAKVPLVRLVPVFLTKAVARMVFAAASYMRSVLAQVRSPFDTRFSSPGLGAQSLCLVSHSVYMHRKFDEAQNFPGKQAYLIYDLTSLKPVSYASTRFSERFASVLRRALSREIPIFCLSNAVRSDIEKWGDGMGGLPPRIEVCPFSNSLGYPGASVSPISGLQRRNFALFCSTFHPRKNQHLLVAAWTRLAKAFGDGLPDLVMIGRSSGDYSALEAQLAAAGPISSKIKILREIDDSRLRWAYQNALFGIFPSSSEGWGLGVSECLTFGLPVVHSDIPALSEAAQGLMPTFAAGDLDALVTVLSSLLSNPALVEDMRRQASLYDAGGHDRFAKCVFGKLRQLLANTAAV